MPKVIPEVREKLLTTVRNRLLKDGPDAVSLRSIAKECGIAVGTVYNYFPNKDMLIAEAIGDDWLVSLQECDEEMAKADSFEEAVSTLLDFVTEFYQRYQKAFLAMNGKADVSRIYQGRDLLQQQLQSRLEGICDRFHKEKLRHHAVLLTAAMRECLMNPEVSKEELLSLFNDIESPLK